MKYIVEKAKAVDFDELLDTLNVCFSKNEDNSFDKILPAMWRREDLEMSRHLIVRDNGHIAAVVGVYPLETMIAGHKVLFATVGNVGTRPDYRGTGCMKACMTAAMEELKTLKVDVGRLGGMRQRYNRYGFEKAGLSFKYTLSAKNIREYYGPSFGHNGKYKPCLSFRPIDRNSDYDIAAAQTFYANSLQHVRRGDNQRFHDIMTAWTCHPFLATYPDGTPCGFLSAFPNHTSIAEHYAMSPETDYQMMLDWLTVNHLDAVSFGAAAFDTAFNRLVSRIVENTSVSCADNFKVINFIHVIRAMIALKGTYDVIPAGKFTFRIQGYATLQYKDGVIAVTDDKPDVTLNKLEATRFLFGPLPPTSVASVPADVLPVVNALLPLPLWWNYQDRV